jgi:hypothetical protein
MIMIITRIVAFVMDALFLLLSEKKTEREEGRGKGEGDRWLTKRGHEPYRCCFKPSLRLAAPLLDFKPPSSSPRDHLTVPYPPSRPSLSASISKSISLIASQVYQDGEFFDDI